MVEWRIQISHKPVQEVAAPQGLVLEMVNDMNVILIYDHNTMAHFPN